MDDDSRKGKLRALCRDYLMRLRCMAQRHGLYKWWEDTVKATDRPECEPSESEVQALSRLVDDERLQRHDIPNVLGKSYRQCYEDGDFDNIRKLKRVGIYSKVSALLNKNE